MASIGLINPSTVVWELIPFSFVVDWFLPIGNFLHGLSALTGTSTQQGCYGYVQRMDYTMTSSNSRTDLKLIRKNDYFRRWAMNSYIPGPVNVLRLKPLAELVNADKAVTSLALLTKVFTNRA
jgi:hypothetical protein